jgi:hypothetical protein
MGDAGAEDLGEGASNVVENVTAPHARKAVELVLELGHEGRNVAVLHMLHMLGF